MNPPEPNPTPTIVATETTTPVPTSLPVAEDWSTQSATNIQVFFRPAIPGEVKNAEHAYIDITRSSGAHQVIAAYPVGGTPFAGEGGPLTF